MTGSDKGSKEAPKGMHGNKQDTKVQEMLMTLGVGDGEASYEKS